MHRKIKVTSSPILTPVAEITVTAQTSAPLILFALTSAPTQASSSNALRLPPSLLQIKLNQRRRPLPAQNISFSPPVDLPPVSVLSALCPVGLMKNTAQTSSTAIGILIVDQKDLLLMKTFVTPQIRKRGSALFQENPRTPNLK